ncbi:COG2958 family protein [Ralstonia solanacearum]|uniref:COG2958 family protein n=1 Tax=Ralstonia solanacearum TaxID=305 RepID=UPI000BD3B311|nr:COG2958 family protein [Ralstonia solanacearum]MBT1536472.1 COG2958 family protein [Ralstonia solanacearum]
MASEKLNLGKTVLAFLKTHAGEKFTTRQIAEWVFETFPVECQAKKARSQALTTDAALLQQLAAEIGSQRPRLQKKHPELKVTEGNPHRYYYSEQSDADEVMQAEDANVATTATEPGLKGEHALYPLLTRYLWEGLDIYTKRIDEKRSSNKRGPDGNRWLFPDLVGMEDLGREWHHEVQDCVKQYAGKRTKLWSFEVKLLLNRSNVRRDFFQAVSNSSWANFGYLVAGEVQTDAMKELRMLSGVHGIGLIRLDTTNPSESAILIPARERPEIDWESANRLAAENKDFLDYLKLVKQLYQTGEARASDWDVPKAPLDF